MNELITPVTDSRGNKVEIRIVNLDTPQMVKGMPNLCESYAELRYEDEKTKAYGRPIYFEKRLDETGMKDITSAINMNLDRYKL
jgi:hypothetical protein